MWEYAATLRKGGLSYSEIQGKLAGEGRTKFGLIKIPSADTIRYQLEKRVLLGQAASPLPSDELESHLKALTYLGNALRYLIEDQPPDPDPMLPIVPSSPEPATWRGFMRSLIYQPEAVTDAEAEVRDEWSYRSSGPESFTIYPYFRQHMDDTFAGRKVNNALDAVDRTARAYLEIRLPLVRGMNPPELQESLVNLSYAQSNLKAALTPPTLVRRMVQDGDCDLCSSKPLARPE